MQHKGKKSFYFFIKVTVFLICEDLLFKNVNKNRCFLQNIYYQSLKKQIL